MAEEQNVFWEEELQRDQESLDLLEDWAEWELVRQESADEEGPGDEILWVRDEDEGPNGY